jgi:hypothetical protein
MGANLKVEMRRGAWLTDLADLIATCHALSGL